MKLLLLILSIFIFIGCTPTPKVLFKTLPKTKLSKSDFSNLPDWKNEDYNNALKSFTNSCKTSKTKKLYKDLCEKAKNTKNPKLFLQTYFTPYLIQKTNKKNILTGYYEPLLKGSLLKTDIYKYPILKTPKDLISIDLSSIYPELKKYRLRGKLQGNKIIPYDARKDINISTLQSETICYTDSKIDLFFLEIQGSGRVVLENNETIFIGYANQNGRKYRAIGRYLVNIGAIKKENISLQSIRKWLEENPSKIDEVLNYNNSLVFFEQRQQPASGSLGIELTPKRSVAVDRHYIPLGAMLYLSSTINNKDFNHIVIAQDTGGAIKGAVRADLFLGYGSDAREIAGRLNSKLKLWILLPKGKNI